MLGACCVHSSRKAVGVLKSIAAVFGTYDNIGPAIVRVLGPFGVILRCEIPGRSGTSANWPTIEKFGNGLGIMFRTGEDCYAFHGQSVHSDAAKAANLCCPWPLLCK